MAQWVLGPTQHNNIGTDPTQTSIFTRFDWRHTYATRANPKNGRQFEGSMQVPQAQVH